MLNIWKRKNKIFRKKNSAYCSFHERIILKKKKEIFCIHINNVNEIFYSIIEIFLEDFIFHTRVSRIFCIHYWIPEIYRVLRRISDDDRSKIRHVRKSSMFLLSCVRDFIYLMLFSLIDTKETHQRFSSCAI